MNRIARFNTFPTLLDDFFNPTSIFSSFGSAKKTAWPAMDVVEGDSAYTVQLDVPGLSKEDIAIDYRDGILQISGQTNSERTVENEGKYYYQERHFGNFSRSLRLGRNVDVEAITAQMENGVLIITIPKQEIYTPKSIPIETPKALDME